MPLELRKKEESTAMGDERQGIGTLCLSRSPDRRADEETVSDSSLASSPLNLQWEHVPKTPPSTWKTVPLVRRLNRRYWCMALALLIIVSLYWTNPYEISEVVSTIDLDKITASSKPIDNAELMDPTAPGYEEHHSNNHHPSEDAAHPLDPSITHAKGTEDAQVQTDKQEEKTKQKPKSKESQSPPSQTSKSKLESHNKSSQEKLTDKDKGGKKDPNDHRVSHPPPQQGVDSEYCTTWPVDPNTGTYHSSSSSPRTKPHHNLTSLAPPGGWRKPKGIKVIAMVFYGRKRYVDILDCYLRANLADAATAAGGPGGGYLDEVWFMVHTTSKQDVDWLHDLVDTVPGYRFIDLAACTTQSYGCIWEYAVGRDTIYLKIDDDILFIHPDAIPQLIHTRIAQPRPYAISAQLVNSPVTGLQALHYGAIHPFLPDPKPHPSPRFPPSFSRPDDHHPPPPPPPAVLPENPSSSQSQSQSQSQTGPDFHGKPPEWRPSTSGIYPPGTRGPSPDLRPLDLQPSYRGHHWVLLSSSSDDDSSSSAHPYTYGSELLRTPLGDWASDPGGSSQNIAFGPGWTSWAAAAQQEYSLLLNIERDEMERYFYGRRIDFGGSSSPRGVAAAVNEVQEEVPQPQSQQQQQQQNQQQDQQKAEPDLPRSPPPQQQQPPGPPGGEQLYDMLYQRYNLNFVAIWGSDVSLALPISDDELEITSEIPKKLGRPFVIDTRSVVSHHSFFTQAAGITQTDLLDRYRGLANELVCEAQGNEKVPWDWGCEGF